MTGPTKKIDDRTVERARNVDVADFIGRFLPLTKRGRDYFACCPFHKERSPSFSIRPDKNFYYCFGCGATGNAVDFAMNYEGLSFPQAVERVIGKLPDPVTAVSHRDTTPRPAAWQAIARVPAGAPEPDFTHWRLGQPSMTWRYADATGATIGYVARFEVTKADGGTGKETLPLCWAVNTQTGETAWRWLAFAAPRPIYGLHDLAERAAAPVLVVEGEKTRDAAARIFTGVVCVSWPGGTKAVDHVDWSPLKGRKVILWPDWDWKNYPDTHALAGTLMPVLEQPGVAAMHRLFEIVEHDATEVVIVPPLAGAPDGWDLADEAPTPGFDPFAYARDHKMPAAEYFAVAEPVAAIPEPANDNGAPPVSDLGFGKPVDLFGVQLPAPLPIDVLPEALQRYVADQAELLGSDHSIVGMAALVAAAACITDSIRLQPKRLDPTWTESARLWVAFVGDPSTKKTPAINKAVRSVKRIDHRMADENANAMADWKYQHEQWKDAKKAKGGTPPPEPKQPGMQRLIVEDTTVEALSEILKDNPRGVLCLQDELTGWFASMDVYKGGGGKGASKDRAHWLETYNGGRRSIDRVTRGSIIVPNWSVCMIGGIQPDMIRRIADSMGNDGLLQRFMVIVARPAKRDVDRMPDMDAYNRFSELFRRLSDLEGNEEPVRMTEGAHVIRERVSNAAVRMIQAFDHPHMRAWLGKWDGLFARLTLLYHVIECATASVHPGNRIVTEATAAQVERLMCGTLLHHAIHFYADIIDANDRHEHMRQIARLILARGMHRITRRDITQLWKPARKMDWWEVRALLECMCSMDWLAPEPDAIGDDGKPRAWVVNGQVHELFVGHAEREQVRRQEVAATIRELRELHTSGG